MEVPVLNWTPCWGAHPEPSWANSLRSTGTRRQRLRPESADGTRDPITRSLSVHVEPPGPLSLAAEKFGGPRPGWLEAREPMRIGLRGPCLLQETGVNRKGGLGLVQALAPTWGRGAVWDTRASVLHILEAGSVTPLR